MGFLLYRYFPNARGSCVPQTKGALLREMGSSLCAGPRVLSIFRVLAEYSLQRAFTRRPCARIVPEVVGCGDLSDFGDCGISNLRVCNRG